MKKIISKLILLLVLFIPSFVKADSCDNYACSTCAYEVPNGTITFKLTSDGQTVKMDQTITTTSNSFEIYANATSSQFVIEADNKLFCPPIMLKSVSAGGRGAGATYTFIKNEAINDYSYNAKETHNEKPVYKKEVLDREKITCNYQNGKAIISTDGVTIDVSSNQGYNIVGAEISHFPKDQGGKLTCPSYELRCAESTGYKGCALTLTPHGNEGEESATGDDIYETINAINGSKYKEKLCELYPYLQKKGVADNYSLLINEKESPLSGWGCNTTYDCLGDDCATNFQFELEGKIKDVAMYCNSFYDTYYKWINKNADSTKARIRECISFDRYYTQLVKGGYVQNLTDSCGGVFSPDTKELIESILDIIKIAGPILAILLGIIDFARAVVGGDADKELKDSGKRFLRRLLAAILLFLIPLILSLLMNLFLKNQPGYNKDNPFCDIGDWGKTEEIETPTNQ